MLAPNLGLRVLLGALAAASLWLLLVAVPSAAAVTRAVSPSGTDSGSCAASPCRSFAYSYRQSGPGDVVEVAGGAYGAQSVPRLSGRTGPAVEFRPVPGATVSLGSLSIRGSFVTVRDMQMDWVSIDAGDGGQTTVENVAIVGGHARTLWVQTAKNLLIMGGSYGGNRDGPTVQIAGSPPSSNVVFDGVDFHDAVATNSTVHMECIWVAGVQGFVVRNSIFRNCAYFDIFFTRLNSPDPRDVLLESNVFESPKQWNGLNAPYALNVANWVNQAVNYTIRNNTFGADMTIQPTSITNVRLVGNLGAIASCTRGVSYAYNVFTKARCSGTDKQVAGAMSQFVNPGGHDWRLKPGAAAIDAANPADAPATDREGLLRNGLPDAGAHEYGGTTGPASPPAPEPAPSPVPEPAPEKPRKGGKPPKSKGDKPSKDGGRNPSQDEGSEPSKGKRGLRVGDRRLALRLTAARGGRSGARLAVRVSRRARLRLTLARRGHRKRVVARRLHAGRNAVRVRMRGLAPGPYRLTLRAFDRRGTASRRVSLRLRVARRHGRTRVLVRR